VPSTVLAVEDSVTMRRVLEITFAGPDFNVVTVDSTEAALQKLKSSKVDVVVTDVTLEPRNGYDLCKAIKQAMPGLPVLILSSKQHPFDAARGSAAQADDHIDKPFDTQQMIDKVKKLLSGGKAEPVPVAAAAQARAAQNNPLASTMVGTVAPAPNRTMPSATTGPAVAPGPAAQPTQQRAKTLVYNPGVAMPPIAGAAPQARQFTPSGRVPATTPVTGVPAARSQTTAATSPSLVAASQAAQANAPGDATAVHINGQMASKLEELGLTAQQIEAVVALSREVVERVVWEVVPVLAETLIKEELARITK
jgi:DNA-binding response OmpR family regulator